MIEAGWGFIIQSEPVLFTYRPFVLGISYSRHILYVTISTESHMLYKYLPLYDATVMRTGIVRGVKRFTVGVDVIQAS